MILVMKIGSSAMKIGSTEWHQAYQLLDEVLDLPVAKQGAWLAALPPEKAHLEPILRSMLADRDRIETNDFLRSLPQVTEFALQDKDPPVDHSRQGQLVEGALIGPYRLLRELGMGGMGAVWLADRADGAMKRKVALKLPHLGPLRHQLAARFERERDILAALSHPHIARLYDAGTTDTGQPYIALEYVEGTPINTYCDEKKLNVEARLTLFRQVLAAVQFAHTNLVIHRDLKPSNIMVTHDGYVRLLDFGIAKFLSDDSAQHNGLVSSTQLTQLGAVALTPDYASPEQISGAPISTTSDVYSLGVVLYELLAGVRPYKLKRGTRGELEEAILSADAPPLTNFMNTAEAGEIAARRASIPTRLKAQLTGEINTLVRKAIEKKLQNRYATVDAFLADINRYLNDQPILARGETFWYSAKKFVLRNRVVVGAAAMVFAALVTGLAATMWQAREVARQAEVAREARARAEASAVVAEEQRNRALAETRRAEESLALATEQSQRATEAGARVEAALNAERAERRKAGLQELMAKEQTKVARIETSKATAVQNYLLDIFKKNSTNQPNPKEAQQTTVRQLLDAGVNEIDNQLLDQPEAKLVLIDTFAELYGELGLREERIALAGKRRTLTVATHGIESDQALGATFEYLTSLLALGSRNLSSAETEAAVAMHAQMLATLDKRKDSTSIYRARMLELECAYRNSGKFGGNPAACDKAINLLRERYRDSPNYIEMLLTMSTISNARAEYAQQELFALEAIAATEKQKLGDWPLVEALSGLVQARLRSYKMKEAEVASARLIRTVEESKSPLSGKVLESYKTYAEALKANFHFAEARDVLKPIIAKARVFYGDQDSLSLRSTHMELANTLSQMGDVDAARPEFNVLMEAGERYSAGTGYHAINICFYAAALLKAGDNKRARVELDRALIFLDSARYGSDATSRVLRSALMAELELREGRPKEALLALSGATVHNLKPSPTPSLQVVRRQSLTGRILVELGRLDEAEAAIEPYLKAIESSPVRQHLLLFEADMLSAKGALQTARRQYDDAVVSWARALSLYPLREIETSPFLAEKNIFLAHAYVRAGRRAEATSLLEKLQLIHTKVIAPREHLSKSFAAFELDLNVAPSRSVLR
jgi:serine/threonine protein kinase